jgi:hypothetical protein
MDSSLPDQFIGKILITGVGRSGTTFLTRLFTLLKMDTGFSPNNMEKHVFKNFNAGMESDISEKQQILKNPIYCTRIQSFVNRGIKIACIIVPIRTLSEAAMSRVKVKGIAGGLWDATNYQSQLDQHHRCLATLVQDATLNEIPVVFLSFDKMIANPKYLYDKLMPLFVSYGLTYEIYQKEYHVASQLSKPKH